MKTKDRKVFYVDVGDLSRSEAEAIIRRIADEYRSTSKTVKTESGIVGI